MTQLEGIALVQAVIGQVREQGLGAVFKHIPRNSEPRAVAPEVLDRFRFDGDVPLTPCMKAWLAFDGSLFGWFNAKGQKLGQLVAEQFGELSFFEVFERSLPRLCYPLPFNHDAERVSFVYPAIPDTIGELPVLTAEQENGYVLVGYPGIDVFLGYHAGLLEKDWRKRFAGRLGEHIRQTLHGKQVLVLGEGEYDPSQPAEDSLPGGVEKVDAKTYSLKGTGPVPPGFRVVRELENPFTKEPMRFLVKV